MAAAARVAPKDYFTPDEWAPLSKKSAWKGPALIAHAWIVIGLAAAMAMAWPITIPLAVMIIGARQLGLAILMHDAAHGALFRSKRLSSIIGHIAMLPSWHVYEGWVLGHNRIHHGHTCRQSMDFVWHPVTPEQFAEASCVPSWVPVLV